MGGQPASGKSLLTIQAVKDHPEIDFLVVNGDRFRVYHPEHQKLINDVFSYSEKTQIFSNVFTEKLIEEAKKRRLNIIVEGTMRNQNVPLATAEAFKIAGFRVEAYIISAPALFSEIGLYSRYQREVDVAGSGRLADINLHNDAVKGLLNSVDILFCKNAVDKISIHSFAAINKIKDFNFNGQLWDCFISPSDIIRQSREAQLNDKFLLSERINTGKETLRTINDNLKNVVVQVLVKLELVANNKISPEKQQGLKE